MLLVFEGVGADGPIRPVQVAAVLRALEEIFLAPFCATRPRPITPARMGLGLRRQSLHIGLAGLRLESPLQVLLALPWHVYTGPFSAFAYGVAHVFGPPTARHPCSIARARTSGAPASPASSPKAEWMEWQAWLEYKHEEVARTCRSGSGRSTSR